MNWWKNGKAKLNKQANPSGSKRIKSLLHAQRIEGETLREYNPSTSHRHLEQVKRYAELTGNCKKQRIKSLYGNTLDILEAKELLDTQNVAEENRVMILGAAQWNDLFNITGFISRDYIPAGSPLASGSLPSPIAGFMPKMTNVAGAVSYFIHPSAITIAIQQSLNINLYDLGSEGVRGSRLNMCILYGIKQLDDERVVEIS